MSDPTEQLDKDHLVECFVSLDDIERVCDHYNIPPNQRGLKKLKEILGTKIAEIIAQEHRDAKT